MKITDPQVIEDGEKDLIQAVQEDLDLDAVRQILKDRMEVSSLASKGGQIVVHDNKIAFRLDFDIQLSGSLLFDRQGNYIDEATTDTPLASEMALESEMDLEKFEDDDIIGEPLSDEIPLVDTGMDNSDLYETDLEDDISDLPEYSLEDEPDDEPDDEIILTDIEDQPLLDLEDDPDIMAEPDGFDAKDLIDEDLDGEILLQEEMLDDDINDILKESREFWEQKKDS